MEYNAVFEGGGVRGIAHVGAACVLEEAGYRLGFFAGSSAGAIVASLLAGGLSGKRAEVHSDEFGFYTISARERRGPLWPSGQGGQPFYPLWPLRRRLF